jgi:hypothetical protein
MSPLVVHLHSSFCQPLHYYCSLAPIAVIKLGPKTLASFRPRRIGWADGFCSNVELGQKPVVVADGLRTLVRT